MTACWLEMGWRCYEEKLVLETIRMSAGANCIMRPGSPLWWDWVLVDVSVECLPRVRMIWWGNIMSTVVTILTSHRDRGLWCQWVILVVGKWNWNIFSILKIEMSPGIFFVLRQYYYFVNIGNTNIADENNNFFEQIFTEVKKFYWYFSRHQRTK